MIATATKTRTSSKIAVVFLLSWICLSSVVDSFGFPHRSRPRASDRPSLIGFNGLTNAWSGTSAARGQQQQHPLIVTATTIPGSRSGSSGSSLAGSLVAADDSWGNLATLAAVGVAAQHLGNSTAVGRLLGAPVTAMATTFALASCGVLSPGGTPSSRALQKLSIQFATPWILLGADFGGGGASNNSDDLDGAAGARRTPSTAPLVFGFGLASLATLVGGWVGWKVAGASLVASALGSHDGLAIAAALLAKNIGGGINYVAVCAALRASPEAIATGLCIDNIGALVYFPISNVLAGRYPDVAPEEAGTEENPSAGHPPEAATATAAARHPMTSESISVAFFAASTLLWLGEFLAARVLRSPSAQIPVVTLLAVVLAGIVAPAVASRTGTAADRGPWPLPLLPRGLKPTCDTLGTVCLYLFFTTAGAPGIKVARSMVSALWPLSVFSVLLYAIHGSLLAACYQFGSRESRLARFRNRNTRGAPATAEGSSWHWRDVVAPQRLLVASSSAIGGPPTSVALARTVGWDSLVVPALLVGNIGYAVSTFVGIAFYYYFR